MNKIGQYRSNVAGGIGAYTSDSPDNYATLIKDGEVMLVEAEGATIASEGEASMTFQDSCVFLKNTYMTADYNYYFHGKIKLKEDSTQTFSVVLIDSTGTYENQFIKTIECTKGEEGTFKDVEFVFHPFATYDKLCFELKRESIDYRDPRSAIIIYLELSVINNILKTTNIYSKIGENGNLLKIGVQGKSGNLMCINGNEIRIGRSGIFELDDKDVTISFLSVFNGASEISNSIDYSEITSSACYFSSDKQREISLFSLDYTYTGQ